MAGSLINEIIDVCEMKILEEKENMRSVAGIISGCNLRSKHLLNFELYTTMNLNVDPYFGLNYKTQMLLRLK